MKKILLILLCLFLIITNQSKSFAKKDDSYRIKRYAIIAGANYGGPNRVRLKYAVSDAQAFKNVMIELGGCSDDDTLLLINPDKRNFYSALRVIYQKTEKFKGKFRKTEFFFYYSGHSDEEGILLGRQKISYKDLKNVIKNLNSDVKIVILDSCSSGAFARIKGGTKKAPFLIDTANDMKGNAIMTSSSIDEASQESDRIHGSFFTHYLISGLRGAADVTQDKRITLNEVYQFAYNETLARTEKTLSGAQHPNYHIQMTGTGDVILTDIKKSTSSLIFHRKNSGKFFIRDSSNILVTEFSKPYGNNVTIALPADKYFITNNKNGKTYSTSFVLKNESNYTFYASSLIQGKKELTTSRGNSLDQEKFPDNSETFRDAHLFKSIDTGIFDKFSGYGALIQRFSTVSNKNAALTGIHGGVIVNNKYVIGGGGFVLIYPTDRSKYRGIYSEEEQHVDFGYGGILLEYYFFPGRLYRVSAGFLIGAGGLGFSIEDEDRDADDSLGDSYFVIEPEIKAFINVTSFFRLGASVSYRFINGIDNPNFFDESFSGPSFSVIFAFGVF